MVFYFDFISPYAYLAWKRVHALGDAHGRTIEPAPVLFAAMLDAHGTRGPAEVPAKREYVFKDASRRAALAGLPLVPPPAHPFNPLLALRVASIELDPRVRRDVIDALFDATWGGGPGVTDPAVVAAIVSRAGADGEELLSAAQGEAVKRRLRERTDEAISRGAFGVPTLFVDGELFWGYESLDLAARRMDGADLIDDALLSRWRDLPAGAQRARRSG